MAGARAPPLATSLPPGQTGTRIRIPDILQRYTVAQKLGTTFVAVSGPP